MARHEIPDWQIPSSSTCSSTFENDRLENDLLEPIAIIGMALQFPGEAINTEYFWKTMLEGRNLSRSIPKSRMNASSFYHPDNSRGDTVSLRHPLISLKGRISLLTVQSSPCKLAIFSQKTLPILMRHSSLYLQRKQQP